MNYYLSETLSQNVGYYFEITIAIIIAILLILSIIILSLIKNLKDK